MSTPTLGSILMAMQSWRPTFAPLLVHALYSRCCMMRRPLGSVLERLASLWPRVRRLHPVRWARLLCSRTPYLLPLILTFPCPPAPLTGTIPCSSHQVWGPHQSLSTAWLCLTASCSAKLLTLHYHLQSLSRHVSLLCSRTPCPPVTLARKLGGGPCARPSTCMVPSLLAFPADSPTPFGRCLGSGSGAGFGRHGWATGLGL